MKLIGVVYHKYILGSRVMRVNTKGRYALMAIVEVALVGSKERPVSISYISEKLCITANYLEQIFSKIRRKGLVDAVKGPGGGYYISKNLEDISVLDVFRAVNEPVEMTRCAKENRGCINKSAKCTTHFVWSGLNDVIDNYFQKTTLKTICDR